MPEVTRKYVIPGEVVAEGNLRPAANVIRINEKLYSTRIGLAEISRGEARVIPLSGPYTPRVDDMVIGKIVDYSAFSWEVDINSCFFAYLPAQSVFGRGYSPARDSLLKKFAVGDMIAAKIMAFDRTRDPLLSISGPGLGRIPRGEIVKIMPTRVPRLIGTKGSMIKSIEAGTGTRFIIGQNGLVVITGPSNGVSMAVKAIRLVEQEAHTVDLTKRVQALLSGKEGSVSE